jgi:hypothetical protein
MSQPELPTTPRDRYEAGLRAAERDGLRASRIHDALAWGRVAALVLAVGVLYLACEQRHVSVGATAGVLAAVLALSIAVGRFARIREEAGARSTYYRAGLARLDGAWPDPLPDGRAFEEQGHLYAADLDLFGGRSLFALLCQARTSPGQQTLAAWLQRGADRDEVLARQQAVEELARKVELRERLWRVATVVGRETDPGRLARWMQAGGRPRPWERAVAAGLGVVGAAGVVALFAGAVGIGMGIFLVQALLVRALLARRPPPLPGALGHSDELAAIASLIAIAEREPFTAQRLMAMQRSFSSDGRAASRRAAEFARRVAWLESRRNPFFWLVSTPLLLGRQLELAIEAWRARHGEAVVRWIGAVGELEALASLATFAYEHPALPFPELAGDDEGPRFEARELGHPLIPSDRRVTNDVALGGETRLLLVSGSNMSGKSTLLRTIGVNTVLALAGAPVCAAHLRLSSLAIGATLRTFDSLEAGVSRFFAEIQRLRAVVGLAEKSPLTLFLLDEILHGTNSKDRLAGARAIVGALLGRGALGLVTTHDLALARLVDELVPAAKNVHFDDRIEDGQLIFDYRLRPGIVTRSNALSLMRLVGLPVDDPGPIGGV